MDGHASHVTWEFFDYCLKHKIIPFCLPPHSTHLLQPLDIGLFGPLQRHYSNILDEAAQGGELGINKGMFLQYVYLLRCPTFSQLTLDRYLFRARRMTYTTKNICAAWEAAGIWPFNPRRVSKPKISASANRRDSLAITATPRNSRMARSTTKLALSYIKGNNETACKLRAIVKQMDKGLQQAITDKEINDHVHQKIRETAAKKSKNNFTDRKLLSKARVITTEEVIRLREIRETADATKAAKPAIKEEKKKKNDLGGKPSKGKGKGRVKKAVKLSNGVMVHRIDHHSDEEEWLEEEDEGSSEEYGGGRQWKHIDDFGATTPQPRGTRVTRSQFKGQ